MEKKCNDTELWKSATHSDILRLAGKVESSNTLIAGTKKFLTNSIDIFRDEVKGFRQKMDEYEHVRMEKYYS